MMQNKAQLRLVRGSALREALQRSPAHLPNSPFLQSLNHAILKSTVPAAGYLVHRLLRDGNRTRPKSCRGIADRPFFFLATYPSVSSPRRPICLFSAIPPVRAHLVAPPTNRVPLAVLDQIQRVERARVYSATQPRINSKAQPALAYLEVLQLQHLLRPTLRQAACLAPVLRRSQLPVSLGQPLNSRRLACSVLPRRSPLRVCLVRMRRSNKRNSLRPELASSGRL